VVRILYLRELIALLAGGTENRFMLMRANVCALLGLFCSVHFGLAEQKEPAFVEQFAWVDLENPILHPHGAWSDVIGRSWSFVVGENDRKMMVSSPNRTDEFGDNGRIFYSLADVPQPIGRIVVELAIREIKVLDEDKAARPPLLIVNFAAQPSTGRPPRRAAALSLGPARAKNDPVYLEQIVVSLAVDREESVGEETERRASLPEGRDFREPVRIEVRVSPEGDRAQFGIEGEPLSEFVTLAFPFEEVQYLGFSQYGLLVEIRRIEFFAP